MAGSYTSLSKLFHWLFDSNHSNILDDHSDVCIFKDLLKLVRLALTCFLFMIAQTLIEESTAQALINSLIQTCAHGVATALSLVPPQVLIIIAFSMCFVFLPQIAKLVAPVMGRLQQYVRKYFPTQTSAAPTRPNIPSTDLTQHRTLGRNTQSLVNQNELSSLKSEVEKILTLAMTILVAKDHTSLSTNDPIKPIPMRGHASTNSELKACILKEVSKQLTAVLIEEGITISNQEITLAVEKAYCHTMMPKNTIQNTKPKSGDGNSNKETHPPITDLTLTTDENDRSQFRVIKKAFEDILTRQTPTSTRQTPTNTPHSPTRSYRQTPTPRSVTRVNSMTSFVSSI